MSPLTFTTILMVLINVDIASLRVSAIPMGQLYVLTTCDLA